MKTVFAVMNQKPTTTKRVAFFIFLKLLAKVVTYHFHFKYVQIFTIPLYRSGNFNAKSEHFTVLIHKCHNTVMILIQYEYQK